MDDRLLYKSTGKGVKNIITDSFIDRYTVEDIRPFMRAGDYDRAIIEMLDIIYEMLLDQDDVEKSKVHSEWSRCKDCLISDSVAGLLGCFYIKYKRETEYRECIICLEDFPNTSSSSSGSSEGNNNNVRPTSVLACGHKFGSQCLDEWFDSRSRTEHRCPVFIHQTKDSAIPIVAAVLLRITILRTVCDRNITNMTIQVEF